MIPYLGDLAKLGKLPKYAQSLEKAISLARKSTKFRKPLEVIPMKAGELVAEYVELARPANRQIGQWMVRAQGAVSARKIALSDTGSSTQSIPREAAGRSTKIESRCSSRPLDIDGSQAPYCGYG